MDQDPMNIAAPNERARQALERLQIADSLWNHGGWRGGSPLSPKQQLDGLFWALLQTDPLIEVHGCIPPEDLDVIPPAPPMNQAVLEEMMRKLERVARLYAFMPEVVIAALGRMGP